VSPKDKNLSLYHKSASNVLIMLALIVGHRYESILMAICILQSQHIHSSAETVLSTLCDHVRLNRFFNASFSIISAEEGVVRRQVTILGYQFIEHVTQTDLYTLEYYIAGPSPVKNHSAKIKVKPLKAGCQLTYLIHCDAKWWQPTWLLRLLITHDLKKALIKLKAYCDAS